MVWHVQSPVLVMKYRYVTIYLLYNFILLVLKACLSKF